MFIEFDSGIFSLILYVVTVLMLSASGTRLN